MNTLIKSEVNGWPVARANGTGTWRIQDIALAKRLGYQQPRDIRKLIRRMGEKGELRLSETDRDGEVLVRHAMLYVEKCGAACGIERRDVTEFWLTRAQALKVSARSETPFADAVLDEIIGVFELALTGKLPGRPDVLAKVAETRSVVDANLGAFTNRLSSDRADVRSTTDAKFAALQGGLSLIRGDDSRSAGTLPARLQQGNASLTISGHSRLNALRKTVTQLLVDVHHKKPRAAWRIVQNTVEEASGWCGKLRDLPLVKCQAACRALERLKASLAGEGGAGRQPCPKL